MMYATKIKMQRGCGNSYNLQEIDSIYIEGCTQPGFYKKAAVHDCVKKDPGSIRVNIYPYPSVIDATSSKGEKYVRSSPNRFAYDNLLDLPRE